MDGHYLKLQDLIPTSAVLAEKNPQVLKGVIKNDSDKGVRETAIKRLKKLNS
jgi:hypothetical protein